MPVGIMGIDAQGRAVAGGGVLEFALPGQYVAQPDVRIEVIRAPPQRLLEARDRLVPAPERRERPAAIGEGGGVVRPQHQGPALRLRRFS